MIARLEGVIQEKSAHAVVVMAGGVGYEVFIPLSTYYDLPDEGESIALHIQTVVREDALELFGFLTRAEKEAFLILNSVSRVGPRLAVSILSGIKPVDLVHAVSTNNPAMLNGVPGVGAKTAQRLVLELKDKITRLIAVLPRTETPADASYPLDDVAGDVVSALKNLGYGATEAERAAAGARRENPEAEIATLIRLSLKRLQKR